MNTKQIELFELEESLLMVERMCARSRPDDAGPWERLKKQLLELRAYKTGQK